MKLGVLTLLMCYWIFFFLFFSGIIGSPLADEGYTSGNISELDTDFSEDDIGSGSILDVMSAIGKFFMLALFGIGLPSDTPAWASICFVCWQTFMTIFTIGFIVSTVWNG